MSKTKQLAIKALSMTAMILIELVELSEDFAYLSNHRRTDSRSVRLARYDYNEFLNRQEAYMRRQALRRLRERKLITLRKEGDKMSVKLTKSGKVKALQAIISSAPGFSDGRICLVSFDVPEAARDARVNFRNFLKRTKFKFVQGSVWSTDKDSVVPMKELIKALKIGKWVEVYTATK